MLKDKSWFPSGGRSTVQLPLDCVYALQKWDASLTFVNHLLPSVSVPNPTPLIRSSEMHSFPWRSFNSYCSKTFRYWSQSPSFESAPISYFTVVVSSALCARLSAGMYPSTSTIVSWKKAQYQISTHPHYCFNFLQRSKVYSKKCPPNWPSTENFHDARLVYSYTENDAI